jgi:hypothetical protein
MFVIKRDGRKEPVHFDKITSRISKLCYGLNEDFVDPVLVSQKASLLLSLLLMLLRVLYASAAAHSGRLFSFVLGPDLTLARSTLPSRCAWAFTRA